ncbi:SIR2 family protein [Corynebacterium glutamicum]|uniref:SIR2 family protein n=1 Tax=Corynebacterium glutamicum TaxID=1718 RepID=UPI00071F86CA|nr:SIR2 family protein [Corynebacterium glutamicum]ALP48813.1 hypothetical protein AC079_00375 [Corynebacterium glutamicum]ANU32345.1 hypothetical protein BBD29_00370 [Corynebacterium glutamicum]QWQ83004.1 hypothetical protein B5C28_00370 [Corynebacterium glutamicum]WFP71829.1 SIR2 family protein [Corynebacterium glutamicum]BAV21832.1 hypothetical 133.7 kDa protein y4cA [Corynebacterium glutamicum]
MQIIKNVDIPLQLIEAQETDQLVVFVGAGASKSAPANLPDFSQLARQLGRDAQAPLPLDNEPLDQYLGRLKSNNFNVHHHAQAALDQTNSRPNETHRAIVSLALTSRFPRIITTNFDTLINQAWMDAGIAPKRWVGPALPLGDNFSGIVQIHGALDEEDAQIILTDADFGEAYVTRGWASRFLVDVFSKFTVLFVGYSHRDPIMRYLAHGLPQNTSRFALLGTNGGPESSTDKKFMEDFGITVIEYPSDDGHVALPEVLNEWARRSGLDKLGVRQEIKEVIRNLDNATPPEQDFLAHQLNTDRGITDFATITSKLDRHQQDSAFKWIRDHGVFQRLFDRSQAGSWQEDTEQVFGAWAASYFTQSEDSIFECWRCLSEYGSLLRLDFYERLLRYALDAVQKEVEGARALVIYLRTSVPGITSPLPRGRRAFFNEDWDHISEAELARLIEARITVDNWPFSHPEIFGSQISFNPSWDISSHVLESVLERIGDYSALPTSAIVRVLENSLIHLQSLLDSVNAPGSNDFLSVRRPSIGLDEQSFSDEAFNPIIDFLREYVREQSGKTEILTRWWDSEVVILQKLAVFGLSYEETMNATEKIEWITTRPQLLTSSAHSAEVLQVMSDNIESLSRRSRQELLDVLLTPTQVEAEDHSAYRCHKILRALLRKLPDWEEANRAVLDLESEFPSLKQMGNEETFQIQSSEHLKYTSTLVDDLKQTPHLNESLRGFFARTRKGGISADEVLNRESQELASEAPQLALDAAIAASELKTDPFAERFISRVLLYVDRSSLARLTKKIASLASSVNGEESITAVARAISSASEEDLSPAAINELEQAIDELWSRNIKGFDREVRLDLRITSNLNDWPGILITATVRLIFAHWSIQKDDWTGFPRETKDRLDTFLSEEGKTSAVVAQAFTASLRFFLSADEEFAEDRIIPLFEEDSSGRTGAWLGFLSSPFYAPDYPVAGSILSLLYDGWNFLSENAANDSISRSFFDIITTTIKEGVYPIETIQDLLLIGTSHLPEAISVDFLEHLGRTLAGEKGSVVWENGVKDFIHARAEGKPKEPSEAERAALADLPIAAPRLATELVSVIGDTSAIPVDKVPYSFDLEKVPFYQQEVVAAACIERLKRNGIDPKVALTWQLKLTASYGNQEIPNTVQNLISQLEEFS